MSVIPKELSEKGWLVFPEFIKEDMVNRVNAALEDSIALRRKIQIQNGIGEGTEGTAHHILADSPVYLELLESLNFDSLFREYFKGNYILNSYGGFSNKPKIEGYVNAVHRDVRTFNPEMKMLSNLLLMLDDFTVENGATWVLSESHLKEEKPNDTFFYSNSERVIGKRGSVLIFDSNLWHAAGTNYSNNMRRAVTITYARPFFKQQFDYCRMLGYDKAENLSDYLRQVIGYNARVPATLDEYYQPPEKRMYKRDQG